MVEDSNTTYEDLAKLGVSDLVMEALELLTHVDNDGTDDNYSSYIKLIGTNEIAHAVKLADLADNLNIGRLSKLNEHDTQRINKYLHAREMLLKTKG